MKRAILVVLDGIRPNDIPKIAPDAVASLQELSSDHSSIAVFWELAGLVSYTPMPTFPNGFPKRFIKKFEEATGHHVIVNRPYSGSQVLDDFGGVHTRSGDLILFTSQESVFQLAAHEKVVPVEDLYKYCEIARKLLFGKLLVGQVIARPFSGDFGHYEYIEEKRHVYSMEPSGRTMLDALKDDDLDVFSVGKVIDIFAARGITDFERSDGFQDGLEKTLRFMEYDFNGLLFSDLSRGEALWKGDPVKTGRKNMEALDENLPKLLKELKDEDVLFVTSRSTFSMKEGANRCHPLFMYGKNIVHGQNCGDVQGLNGVSATIMKYLGVKERLGGPVLPVLK